MDARITRIERICADRKANDGGHCLDFDHRCACRDFSRRRSRSIIGAFYEVYNSLGYGFLEHLYVLALEQELIARGHKVSRQVGVPVYYRGRHLGTQRLDMIVDDKVIIEIKSTLDLHPAAHRQLRSYLQGTKLQLGFLLHFGPEAKFYRIINSKK